MLKGGFKMVYLDNAATTAVRPEVLEVIHDSLMSDFGNPSSTYRIGKKVKHAMIQARKQLAELLNVDESEVYFTSGATEANNWAIRSKAEKSKELGHIMNYKKRIVRKYSSTETDCIAIKCVRIGSLFYKWCD